MRGLETIEAKKARILLEQERAAKAAYWKSRIKKFPNNLLDWLDGTTKAV